MPLNHCVDTSNQRCRLSKRTDTTDARGEYLNRSEKWSLLASKIRNLDSIKSKEATQLGVWEKLVDEVNIGFDANSNKMKKSLSHFIACELSDTAHHALIEEMVLKAIDGCTQSDIFINKLVEKVCNYQKFIEGVRHIINPDTHKTPLRKHETKHTFPDSATQWLSTTSEDGFTDRRNIFRWDKEKKEMGRAQYRIVKKPKKTFRFSFPTQSWADTKYISSTNSLKYN